MLSAKLPVLFLGHKIEQILCTNLYIFISTCSVCKLTQLEQKFSELFPRNETK